MQVFLTAEYLAISMEYAKGGDMFQYVKTKGGLQVFIPYSHNKRCWSMEIVGCSNCTKHHTCQYIRDFACQAPNTA